MRLIVGKILVLVGVISLGSGIAYVAFKRMPPDGRAVSIASDRLKQAVALAEDGKTAPRDPDGVTATTDDNSPFALTEPSADALAELNEEQSDSIPATETKTEFQFELSETAATVTPVSFTSEDDGKKTNSGTGSPSALTAAKDPGPASEDTSSDQASVMFFNAGKSGGAASEQPTDVTTPSAAPGSEPKSASANAARSAGGFTLLPAVDPPPTKKPATPTSPQPTSPRNAAKPPVSASRAARGTASSTPAPKTSAPVTSPAATGPTVAAAAKPATTGSDQKGTAAPQPAPVSRTRPQPQPRTPAVPAGNLFFTGNTPAPTAEKPSASAASTTPSPDSTPSAAITSSPAQSPKPRMITQASRSSSAANFPATATPDETSKPRPIASRPTATAPSPSQPEPFSEPSFPPVEPPAEEPKIDAAGPPVNDSTATASNPPEDLPFMRSPREPEKSFNPFEPAEPAEPVEPKFEPSFNELDKDPPVARTQDVTPTPPKSTPPDVDPAIPEPVFPELSVPPAVPSFPVDQRPQTPAPETTPTKSPVVPRNQPTPTTTPTPAPTPTPASTPTLSPAPVPTPAPFAAPAVTPAPSNPKPFPSDSAKPRVTPPITSTPAANPFEADPATRPTESAERTEPDEPAFPDLDEPPVRPNSTRSADLPAEVPLPTEPRPFSADTKPAVPSNTSGRAVENLRTMPERPSIPTDTAEPFPIMRGGSSARSQPTPSFPATTPAEPEPFPLTETPGPDMQEEAQPLPPFEEIPSRTGGESPSSFPERTPERTPGRTPSSSPVRAVEKLRPQLTIEKKAPESATIGIAHEYRIVVSNDGDTAARDVVVEDELNGAAEFVSSNPPADYDRNSGVILWNFEELAPQESREIVVRVRPTGEGMLTGTATVRFRTEVRSATLIRAPKLQLDIDGPEQVLVGDDVKLRFTIRNAGSGDAAGVLLRSVLPNAIRHPEGADLEYEIELLRAGDEQTVDLTAVAAEPGRPVRISAEISASGIPPVIARNNVTIVGSQLTVERLGPAKRFIGRPARFQNVVINESEFEALDAVITEDVPDGMRVIAVGSGGEYNPKTRRITWQVPRISAGEQTVLEVELQPDSTGRMESIVEVVEKAGFRSRAEENTVVEVEGLHNVTANISRQDQPVAVGERFGFTVAVDNRGTAVARNVELTIQVPAGLQVLAAGTREIPGRLLPGNVVRYSIVRSLKPGDQLPFQVTLQGREAVRNAVIQAQLKYDEMTQPLIISESVTVFDDQP